MRGGMRDSIRAARAAGGRGGSADQAAVAQPGLAAAQRRAQAAELVLQRPGVRVADGAGQRVGRVGAGVPSRDSRCWTIICTCSLAARPVPTTAFLICSAVYSCTASALSASAHSAAPRAWPSSRVEAGLVFRKTISSAATSGRVSCATWRRLSRMTFRRSDSASDGGTTMVPLAT